MNRTVLVVDDEPDIRLMLGALLSVNGYDVLQAPTGREALELLEENHTDAVLLDIRLPDIDGWEVLRHMRAEEHTADIPVVLVSAYAGQDARTAAADLGCLDVFDKPFAAERLVETIDRLVAV
ncbi:MAG: response regulator [Actinomycetota bacterium]